MKGCLSTTGQETNLWIITIKEIKQLEIVIIVIDNAEFLPYIEIKVYFNIFKRANIYLINKYILDKSYGYTKRMYNIPLQVVYDSFNN